MPHRAPAINHQARPFADTGRHERPRVLIVDDDDDLRDLYTSHMTAAGWLVEAVANGEEVLFVAAAFAPDVIVMDLLLPLLGGFEAAARLKTSERTMHIPIVACSGLRSADVEAQARAAGCVSFVAKPCPPERLRTLLGEVVWGPGSPR